MLQVFFLRKFPVRFTEKNVNLRLKKNSSWKSRNRFIIILKN